MSIYRILVGDLHLRDSIPACRDEEFMDEQFECLAFIEELRQKYNCDVLCSGDLLHHWKASPWLLSKLIEFLPKRLFTIIGNHDMPFHSLENMEKSGLAVLERAGVLSIIYGNHWGIDEERVFDCEGRKVMVSHVMTYKDKHPPYPGIKEPGAKGLLKKYKRTDLHLTGHNHQNFTQKISREGKTPRLLINPGCMTRQTMTEADYKPCVYVYNAKENTAERVYLPTRGDIVKPETSVMREEREKRIDAFVSQLEGFESGVDFAKNIEQFFSVNSETVSPEVKKIIYESLN